jgi:Xanthine and CO dehydrogenases maturation factor, XdhC/CoxF family
MEESRTSHARSDNTEKAPASIWAEIRDRLAGGAPVAVVTIVADEGSTPRGAGAKMLVGPEGRLAGTIGGGVAEARAVEEAAAALEDGEERLFSVDMTGSAETGADLICGGKVWLLVQRLSPEWAGIFASLCERTHRGLDSFLLSPIQESGNSSPTLTPWDEATEAVIAAAQKARHASIVALDGKEFLLEPVYANTRLVLAGGGHVSRAVAEMAGKVDFETTVLDDRAEFVVSERFPWLAAERRVAVPEFKSCLTEGVLGFPVNEKCFVAILTRGHSFDTEVLGQALTTSAGYIGMIGSRRKREAVYETLLTNGFSQTDLDRVYCPIGLAIGSETPEEIAVSIVAELIAVRAGMLPPGKG